MMTRNKHIILLFAFSLLIGIPAETGAQSGIINSKHNLSSTGPGTITALTETRICVFCHTPHNAHPATPLWNKKIDALTYTTYTSSTMEVIPSQPSGPTRLCLSCHDGMVALGAVLQPAAGINMTTSGPIPSGPSLLGTVLTDDHPVSFSYYDSLYDKEIVNPPPPDVLLYGNGNIHCSTCHDPHDNRNKKFLVIDNVESQLCRRCHQKGGWDGSSHKLSTSDFTGGSPYPWPRTGAGSEFNWITVKENGCENCHAPHAAGGQKRLLNYAAEEENCSPCHNGNVAAKNIAGQFLKISKHSVDITTGVHDPRESPKTISDHVECADCHNSHAVNDTPASSGAPKISGRLARVSGVSIDNSPILPPFYTQFEYEICFKCHADSSPLKPFSNNFPIHRQRNSLNTRLEFNTDNPSFHPVAGIGKNREMPSLVPPSTEPDAPTDLTDSSMIYCTDCHSDESVTVGGSGSRGPHGSQYPPLLKKKYEVFVGTLESSDNYAVCYRCHNRASILNNQSFKQTLVTIDSVTAYRGGHSGHLRSPNEGKPIPCAVCHDPHGVNDDGMSGSHTHLINFSSAVVTALSPNPYPLFTDKGSFAGSCTLECHFSDSTVKIHNNATYQ